MGGPGTAGQPHFLAYVSDRTLITLRYLGNLRCRESPPTTYYVESVFTLPGIKIPGHFVTSRGVVGTMVLSVLARGDPDPPNGE